MIDVMLMGDDDRHAWEGESIADKFIGGDAVGELIMASAFSRQESRGLHYNADFPELAEHGASTIITDSFRRRHGVSSLTLGTPAPGVSNLVPAPAGEILFLVKSRMHLWIAACC